MHKTEKTATKGPFFLSSSSVQNPLISCFFPAAYGPKSPVLSHFRAFHAFSSFPVPLFSFYIQTHTYYGAPVVVLVLADGSASTFVEDGSCVLENMMLAAHALGLGTVWVHREREIFDSEKGKALLREWKLPETLRGVGAVALGYPAQEASQPAARKQNYIVRI